jgi:hypothetical protein
MSHRFLTTLLLAAASLASLPLAGQTAPKRWTQPKTADGQPDLQGVWTNPTITPFERPGELAGKPVLTDQEAATLEEKAAENRVDRPPKEGDVGNYNQVWFDSGTKVVATKQTSLVVDPPDGRVPVKPEAETRREYNLTHNADSYEYMSLWDRCITRGVPGAMFPAGYNNAYQIVQTPGYVVLESEMIHNARIIPIDGRQHVSSAIRQWDGDSRGHWEGNTLVVDTTNYNNRSWISTSAAGGRIKGIMPSDKLHVVERFTRVNADTIRYEVTIDDPNTFTKPWKVSIPLTRDGDYKIYEYACQEGNYAMVDILNGGRVEDAEKKGSR